MSDFNSMTIAAAAEVIAGMTNQTTFTTLVLSWGVDEFCSSGSVLSRANDLVRLTKRGPCEVPTVHGRCDLTRAMVNHAITADADGRWRNTAVWSRLVAGLKMDSFEIMEISVPTGQDGWNGNPILQNSLNLRRMLPEDVPQTDFREAESELVLLLNRHGFSTSKGHLDQAISNFSQGNWAGANAQFRSFFEGLIKEIAQGLGHQDNGDHRTRVRFLGELVPPFFLESYNEWKGNDNAPQYVHGLMSRMHPEGSHPGLSEEEDCTFRFQIILVTARLFLRRYDKRLP